MKKFLPLALLIAFVVAGSLYILTRVDTSTWKTYTNISYEYQVTHPADMPASYIASYKDIPVEQSYFMRMGNQNDGSVEFTVTAYDYRDERSALDYDNLQKLPLQQLAETMRQKQIADKNIYTPDKQTGDLKEITFAGQKAYSFTQSRGFNGINGAYSFSARQGNPIYNFIFFENKKGVKLMISYPLGDAIAEKIKDSFQLTGLIN